MKSFSSLIFCSLAIAVISSWSLNEKPSFIPLVAAQNQRQRLRHIALHPAQRLAIQKFLQMKYALEWNCLKELCSNVRYRHICYGGRPVQRIKPLPPLQLVPEQQVLIFRRMTENPLTLRNENGANRRYFINDGKIYLQPNTYFNNLRVNFPSAKESTISSEEKLGEISPNETIKVQDETYGLHLEERKNPEIQKNSSWETEKFSIQTDSTPTTKLTEIKPTTGAPHLAMYQTHETPTHQYEVKEIIEEKPEEKYNNDFIGFHASGKKLANVSIQITETKDLKDHQKPNTINTTPKISHLKTFPSFYQNHRKPSHRPRVLIDKNNKPEPPQIRQEEPEVKSFFTKHFQNWRENTTVEPKTHTENFSTFSLKSEHNATETVRTMTDRNLMYTSSEMVMTETKLNLSSKTTENVKDVDLKDSINPNNPDFFPSATDRTFKYSTLPPTPTKGGKPLTVTSEIQTTSSVALETAGNLPREWRFTKHTEQTVNGNEGHLTTPTLKEFTDEPSHFDLFTEIKPEAKKDYDSGSKNSRKMHFEQKPGKNTKSNAIQQSLETGQRRSDILINENNDYIDYENTFSGMNYLENLKQNYSLPSLDLVENLTSDTIIPLIPTVVNDLREGKIPPEDISTLSNVFGKYWTTVLDLSNKTMLDMLPLMKMKDENDLENLLRSLRSEDLNDGKTTEIDDYSNLNLDSYDFIENYKDLYRDLVIEEDQSTEDYNFDTINVTPQY